MRLKHKYTRRTLCKPEEVLSIFDNGLVHCVTETKCLCSVVLWGCNIFPHKTEAIVAL